MNPKILTIVPARAGSKRLPGKNKKILGNKPLIEWTFEFANYVNEFSTVIVSTDDLDVVKLATKNNIDIPFIRPSEISGDTSTPFEYVNHALKELETRGFLFSDIMLLQPTSPFRDFELLYKEAKSFAYQKHFQSIMTVKNIPSSIYWSLEGDKNQIRPVIDGGFLRKRSQDLPSCFLPCGSFYMTKIKSFLKNQSFFCEPIKPIIINDEKYLIDIDDMEDFVLAEKFIQN